LFEPGSFSVHRVLAGDRVALAHRLLLVSRVVNFMPQAVNAFGQSA
jgi:hypothetical protein